MTLTGYHCGKVLQENWNRFGCPDTAVVLYVDKHGAVHGYCARHAQDGRQQALVKGWTEQEKVA